MPVEFRTIEPPTSWQIFPRHPEGKGYRDLSKVLAKRMREGIEKYGVMLRPVVLKRESNGLFVLDGWQMYQACIAANVKPDFVELVVGIEPKDFVKIKNDYRRHETIEEKRKRLRDRNSIIKEARASGRPSKEIAKEVGVTRSTVNRVLHNGVPRCDRCERVNASGDDCPRCQLLRMDAPKHPDPTGEDAPSTTSEEEEPSSPKPPKLPEPPELPKEQYDANFVIIPERVTEAFAVAAELTHFCREIDRLQKDLHRLMNAKVGTRYISSTLPQRLEDFRQHIWQARAAYVCPYCQGREAEEGCTACKGQGWQSKAAFAQAPPEFQNQMRQMGARNVPI